MSVRTGKITLKDLAARTGVSPTAISHVLNDRLGHVRVSESTRRKVVKVAAELGYVPRLQARSMATRRSYAIAALCSAVPEAVEPTSAFYLWNAIGGVEAVCKAQNYHCVFATCPMDDSRQFVEPRVMKDGAVDGAILIGLIDPVVARRLKAMDLPCVQLGSNIDPAAGIDAVYADIDAAVEAVCLRLVELGHRRVEFTLPKGPGPERHLRYFASLKDVIPGLAPHAVVAPAGSDLIDFGRAHIRQLLAAPQPAPTAFICNLRQAEGLVAEMSAAGRSLGSDYELIVLATQEMGPVRIGGRPVCTIQLPTADVARRATARLFELIEAPSGHRPPQSLASATVPCAVTDLEALARSPGN